MAAMLPRQFLALVCFLSFLLLTGCGGAPDPVNEGLDRPKAAKKDKEKEK